MDDVVAKLVGPAVVAAVVAGLVAVGTNWANALRVARQRQLETWAEAFRAYVAYKEYPFLVRRRSPDDPAGERVRISTELSQVQQQLGYYTAWAAAESPRVGAVYRYLVARAREVAGAAISRGWDQPPKHRDDAMHVRDVDLSGLDEPERLFRAAVQQHLRPIRSRLNRLDRADRRSVDALLREDEQRQGQRR